MSELHVVLGTGAIGRAVMEELVQRGKTICMVNRSGEWESYDVVWGFICP